VKVILVTGGAGFIGSNFIRYFLTRNKNCIIANIDKQAYPSEMGRLSALENSPRYHHVKGDVCNQDLTEYVLRKYRPSWIVNFCSEPEPSKDKRKFKFSPDSSFTAAHSLLEGAHYIWSRASCADKKFLQISSDSVYGTTNDDNEFFSEESRMTPDDPHSAIKAGTDLLVEAYHKAYNLPTVILRSCSIYGPWQSAQCPVPSMIKSIHEDRNIEITSSADHKREWMHVNDLCAAITRALFFARPGVIYNAGSGEIASEADIARLLLKLAGKQDSPVNEPAGKSRQTGFCQLNSYRTKCNLRWSKSYHLEEGLADTLNWYEQHKVFLT